MCQSEGFNRPVLSRFRATALFEDFHASLTFTGTWTTPGRSTIDSGTTYKQTTDASATYSIALPADFPGGTVAIGITSPNRGGLGLHPCGNSRRSADCP